MTARLLVQDLTTRLQLASKIVTVVDHVSFVLHPAETVALVGESGCGKSLTALSLLGIPPDPPALPSTGSVIYQGQNLLTLPEKSMRRLRGSRLAMIFQDPDLALNPVFTVGAQLIEVCHLHLHLPEEEGWQRVIHVLGDVGIPAPESRLDAYPHQLSRGMKQRVMIAMAILCEPEVLIADEPTTALDVTVQAQVLDLLRDLQERHGTSILLITHDMGVVAELADRVMIMYASQIVEQGDVGSIFDCTAHPYTRGLFQARPQLSKVEARLPTIKGTAPSLEDRPSGCRFHPRCSRAMPICCEELAPTYALSPSHSVDCWLYDRG